MAAKNQINAIELDSIASAAMTGDYQAVNGTGFEQACFAVYLINDTNQDVTVSYDGSTDHEFVPSGTTRELKSFPNANSLSWVPLFGKGTVVYAKGTAGTGSFYVSGYYIER